MRIVDLFSGAGGLTFGFYYNLIDNAFVINHNCNIVFANEVNPAAAQAFGLNFPQVYMLNRDIKTLQRDEVRRLIGNETVDLVVGGPPCQSYSMVGKRVYDDKAKLYKEYYRMLSIIQPRMFLFENVKGVLSMKDEEGNRVIDNITRQFASIRRGFGYRINYYLLDAVKYGVPQHRERVFIIGVRNDLDIQCDLEEIPVENDELTLSDAISDLPSVTPGHEVVGYGRKHPRNDFQRLMRGNNTVLTCHFVSEYGEKIQEILNVLPRGESKEYINNLVHSGRLDRSYELTSGYKNTYGRLWSDRPCTTITHNMSTPSGLRCIHYKQNRALTPREGARVQSFPDWFVFSGSRVEIKTQIGNAVPPLLAIKLARYLEALLN